MAIVEGNEREATLASRPNFALLLSGQFISQLGDRVAMVAFPWLVWDTTRSALSMATVLALFTLPYVLFGAVAGGVLDRLDRRGVMVAADIARGGLVLAVPLVAQHSIVGVYALAFLTSCATVFFDPGLMALLPDIVPGEELLRANSILSASEHITEVLGYAAAGFLMGLLAMRTAFTIDAMTFGVSAVTLLAITLDRKDRAERRPGCGEGGAARPTFRDQIREGVSYLVRHAGLRANTILAVAAVAGVGASYPLTFLLAARHFHNKSDFGFMEAAIGLGYIIGSLTLTAGGRRVRKGFAITIGLMVMGVCYALAPVLGTLPLVLVDFVVLGAANAVMLISIDTYVQSVVPEHLRGRVWGARFTLTQGVYAVGVLAAGGLAAVVSLGPLFGVCGVIVFVPALIGLFVPVVREV
jgi:MFS family permease